jgi:predicted FMN-binding regulatory protein PaiB
MPATFSDRYPLPQFQATDPDALRLVMETFPLATLISQTPAGPAVTQVPLILDPTRGSRGALIGHMDRNNPHTALMDGGAQVTALFHGPNSYMTPKIYPMPHYPGWNYVTVRVDGMSTVIQSLDEVKDSLARMAAFLEWDREPYVLDRDSEAVDYLARGIVAFEIGIESMQGIFKLAQDKGPVAAEIAKRHLAERSQRDWTALLDRLLGATSTLM